MNEIRKLHFLIHPGYLGDPKLCHRRNAEFGLQQARVAFAKYKTKAKRMEENECLVAFSHIESSELKRVIRGNDGTEKTAYERLVADGLMALRERLGKRFVLLSNRHEVIELDCGKEKVVETFAMMRRILGARGYRFGKNTETEAFGETLGCCVDEAADSLSRAGGFERKTTVNVSLCDLSLPDDHFSGWIAVYLSGLVQNNPRLRYVIEANGIQHELHHDYKNDFP